MRDYDYIGGSSATKKGWSGLGDRLAGIKNNFKNTVSSANTPSGGSGSSGYSSFSYPGFYDLDLSIYDKLLGTLESNYNNSKNTLSSQYQNAINSINNSRRKGAQDFSSGRALIAENSYDRQRQQMNDLASRGLAGSGLQQLGDVQEAMEKGNQVSSLANNYYAYLDDLQERENEVNASYNSALTELENAYNNSVANVEFERWNAKNQYEKDLLDYMTSRASAYNRYSSDNAANAVNSAADTFGNYVNAYMSGYDLTNPTDAALAYDVLVGLQQSDPEGYVAYYNAGNDNWTNWARNFRNSYGNYSGLSEDERSGYTVDRNGNIIAPVSNNNNNRLTWNNDWLNKFGGSNISFVR